MPKPNGCGQELDHRLEPHSGYADAATVKHNTLSAETTHVRVYYPFHPLCGYSLRVLRRPKRRDGAVLVLDSAGKRLKIPVRMTQPGSDDIKIGEQAHLSKESLLNLALLVKQWNGLADCDNLLQPSVNGCKGGHYASATTVKPKPNRRGTGARRSGKSRTGRSHGSHSGDSFPNRSKESE